MSFNGNGIGALKATAAATKLAGHLPGRIPGRLAARLWFTPWRLPLGERALAKQESWLEPTEPVVLEAAGHRLSGYVGGSGPTVLLVHGWGDSSRSMGAFAAPLIDRGYRVVAFDMPAHGETSGGQTDALKMAAAVRAIAFEFGPVHAVIAHSMGAHATTLALRDGLDVDKVVFISPSVLLANAIGPFATMFSLSKKTIDGLRAEIERRYGETVWTDLAADTMVRDDTTPALVIHDPEDPQVPFADARKLVQSWPSARLETAEGLGHTRILRDATVIARAISYLEGGETRRSREERVTASV